MSNLVTVTAKDNNVVISSVNKPEYGFIRVQSETASFVDGWLRKEVRSALIKGKTADLKSLNFKEGQTLPGKLVVIESTTAPYADAKPKMNPSTGEVIAEFGTGLPIYRDCIYTTNMKTQDILISHKENAAASVESTADRVII